MHLKVNKFRDSKYMKWQKEVAVRSLVWRTVRHSLMSQKGSGRAGSANKGISAHGKWEHVAAAACSMGLRHCWVSRANWAKSQTNFSPTPSWEESNGRCQPFSFCHLLLATFCFNTHTHTLLKFLNIEMNNTKIGPNELINEFLSNCRRLLC